MDQQQTEERDATWELVGCRVMRAAGRADDIDGVGAGLRRILGEKLPGSLEIVVGNLDAHAADGIRIQPIHLDEMLILDIRRDACGLHSGAEQVRLLGFAECGDRFQTSDGKCQIRLNPDCWRCPTYLGAPQMPAPLSESMYL